MKLLLALAFLCTQLSWELATTKPIVVCYWPNWRFEDVGDKKHTPENIDPTLCTHIHYAFHILDVEHNVILDSDYEPKPKVYKRLEALKKKNPDVKIIVSLGGAGQPDEDYSHLVSNAGLRKTFIANTIAYLKKYQFDGLDIDWEYPVCWSSDCDAGPKSDKANFGIFVKELREEFDKQSPRLSLSAAVVAGGPVADNAYDFPSMAAALDYINVMTYAAAGLWDHKTGHHSRFTFCISASEYFVNKGIPKSKVLMGVPFYGKTFKLADKNNHGMGAPITGMGHTPQGEGEDAFYREMCELVKSGWTKEQADSGHDPIAYHDNLWVGYDDPYAAYDKSKWVRDNGYGGIIVWEITTDDFRKKCCSVTYPMLRAISHGLYGTGSGPETYGCEHK